MAEDKPIMLILQTKDTKDIHKLLRTLTLLLIRITTIHLKIQIFREIMAITFITQECKVITSIAREVLQTAFDWIKVIGF